ncbi:MAG: Minf_1886 family protein [Chthoniobacteraceae bacterium]
MQKLGFNEAVESILATDTRYDSEAYAFVRDALDFTIKLRKKGNKEELVSRHISGQELLDGVRQYALKEFGPMVPTVFGYWGIQCCEDIGHIVFNLIKKEIFGKSDRDTLEDFKNGFDFHEAFVAPFVFVKAAPVQDKKSNDLPVEKLQ